MKTNHYPKFTVKLLSAAILPCSSINSTQAGSYSYATHLLILDRVKVDIPAGFPFPDAVHNLAQLSLQQSNAANGGPFTLLSNGYTPLTDNFPLADATLSFDASSQIFTLTVLNASGYYGVLTSNSFAGPYNVNAVISVQSANTAGIGATGATGAAGPKGDTGATGPMSPQGPAGAEGPMGIQGLPGVAGPQGLAGAQGVAGPQGITGLQGVAGPTGATGATGAAGSAVLNGPTGPTASDGNLGDLWLDTSSKILYGPKGASGWTSPGVLRVGATGATGAKGETGEQGSPGAPGSQGSAGQQGPQGQAGANGLTTSVNGVTQVNGAISLTKTNFSDLNNLDNTSDLSKPLSTATQNALALKAPLASPTFTGTPAAPTPAASDNSTTVATTAFVKSVMPANGTTAGDMLYWDSTNLKWEKVPAYGGSNTNPSLYFCNHIPQWAPCTTYTIGSTGPSGGSTKVFYVDNSGLHGLEAWGADDSEGSWSIAFQEADAHRVDWRLPSKLELNLMYQNIGQGAANVGSFSNKVYWSSTPDNDDFVMIQDFATGAQGHVFKESLTSVRAVRAF